MHNVNVWKIGSNWGNGGKSVLSLFLDYGVVFFGGANDGCKKGNPDLVAKDDLLVVAEGARVVAVGKVLTPFMPWDKLSEGFREAERKEFQNDDVVGCRAAIELLHDNQWSNWSIDPQKRFCKANVESQKVQECYARLKEDRTFTIIPRKIALHGNDQESALFCPSVRYLVPIYQRPYSWGEAELTRLIQDVLRGLRSDEPIFLGTMQLSKPVFLNSNRTKCRYDIIDGQQRVSSFFLMTRVLSLMGYPPPDTCPDGNLLRTLVDRGLAQRDWDEFLAANLETIKTSGAHRNLYLRNAAFLYGKLSDLFTQSEGEDMDGNVTGQTFSTFLIKKIIFVVIETHAGLSKTIQIFNTINTTGLDLSGADVFKVRFFEFLKDKQGNQDDVFDKISGLYGKVQENNRIRERVNVSMSQILSILQTLIVIRYDLPVMLLDYATDRFFDHLFDTVLGINLWPHFSADKVKTIVDDRSDLAPLSIQGIDHLIRVRYQFCDLFEAEGQSPASDVMLNKLVWQSRYGWRYWCLPVIHLYFYPGDIEGAKVFFGELTRITLCYSLKQRKAVSAAHTCIRTALRKLVVSSEEATQHMAQERKRIYNDVLGVLLKEELAWNPTWKGIACRLSELLTNQTELCEKGKELLERVFDERVDIEHIQAYNDKDGKRREDIWRDWGTWLNGFGNLAILESSINRSISNGTFGEKKEGYKKSRFTTIRDLTNVAQWDLEACRRRCEQETVKLMAWLFPDVDVSLSNISTSARAKSFSEQT